MLGSLAYGTYIKTCIIEFLCNYVLQGILISYI